MSRRGSRIRPAPISALGCSYRTGQNLNEGALYYKTLSKTTFGQYCSYDMLNDGEIYGQPLVVTNVNWQNRGVLKTVVYVVTLNDSIWAFDGKPPAPNGAPGQCTPLAGPVSLLQGSETVVSCTSLGAGKCQTIAQAVGIISTPVIQLTATNPATGNIYVVAESISSGTYIHRVWSLDITNLSITTAVSNTINNIPSSCPVGTAAFSSTHIQRPALLLGADNYLYVAFSMMDGLTSPLPNGMILAYNTNPFTSMESPLCKATSSGQQGIDGAGIWQGGAGPAYGPDDSDTVNFVYFNTGNGKFDANQSGGSDYGDSFIKMTNAGSGSLSVDSYFTPNDQLQRYSKAMCGTEDIDFGSGGVMLIPEQNVKYPYLAVLGEKEGGLYFLNRTAPGGFGGDTTCTGGSAKNYVEVWPINGPTVGTSLSGPEIHNSPAFWETAVTGQTPINYVFISSLVGSVATSGQLMRYQICLAGAPISNSPGCSNVGAYAYEVAGTPKLFNYGVTPTISAKSSDQSDAILWAIWSDGSVVPNSDRFTYNTHVFNPSTNGVLYAFDAANPSDPNMKKLYSSNDCSQDVINPATKFSVPTVANGYVYLGTQGTRQPSNGQFPSTPGFNSGTFYVFGTFASKTCS